MHTYSLIDVMGLSRRVLHTSIKQLSERTEPVDYGAGMNLSNPFTTDNS